MVFPYPFCFESYFRRDFAVDGSTLVRFRATFSLFRYTCFSASQIYFLFLTFYFLVWRRSAIEVPGFRTHDVSGRDGIEGNERVNGMTGEDASRLIRKKLRKGESV